MKCPIERQDSAELLLSYSARRLDPESTAILEAHMEVCPQCREFRDSQRTLWEALDQWEARPISADFNRRLYRKIEEQERLGWWGRIFGSGRPMFLRPALPLAATACLALVAGLFLTGDPDRIVTPAGETPQVREVEQVERTLEDMEMLRQFNLVSTPVNEEGDSSRRM